MGLTKVSTDGVKDDAVTTDKLANAINTERTANTAKVSTTINNNADNRVITGSGTANTLNGESNVVVNGGKLGIGIASPDVELHVQGAGDGMARITSADGSSAFLDLGDVSDKDGGRIQYNTDSSLRFSTASSERMRIDSSGNLALGGFTPPTDLNPAAVPSLFVDRVDNNIFGEDGALYITQNAYFNGSGSYERVTVQASTQYKQRLGKHKFTTAAGGTAGANFTFSEKVTIDTDGLKFNGDSAEANALNDYEEGTWTPVFTDDGTSGNSASSYATQIGWYTKIGNLVNVQMRISNAVFSSFNTSHALFIKGLPYTIEGASGRLTTGSALLSNVDLDNSTMSIGVLANTGSGSNAHFRFFQTRDSLAWDVIQVSQFTSGNNEILVNMSYRTA